ncbi:hypothetical protein PMI19_00383 [Pseudomonas sp. GM16]|uniref:hypothetical protein n=1 Tax=Pseudomonas sp. GM16 TaxID=1144322 RepID=UPI000272327A|nr:hypothetical protein [Pseudomonas sp. GM16]EJM07770.1 hypothetical protein PMI19_00383 [Pseudomonas sp. GM16]
MFYAPSTGGFYDSAFHTEIPSDAVEISQEYWLELLNGLSTGKMIVMNENNYPGWLIGRGQRLRNLRALNATGANSRSRSLIPWSIVTATRWTVGQPS